MKIALIICGICFAIFCVLVVIAGCVASSRLSRQQEKDEISNMLD